MKLVVAIIILSTDRVEMIGLSVKENGAVRRRIVVAGWGAGSSLSKGKEDWCF